MESDFSVSELNNSLKHRKVRSAPGFDFITPQMLKMAVDSAPLFILNLANACMRIGYFPDILKISIIVPIPKKSNSKKIEDLRPISLLPTLGKLIERLIHNRLMIHAFSKNFGVNQFGFMPQRSCEDAINEALRITERLLQRKKCVIWISVDFKSAFDTAWWPAVINGLIRKLNLPQNLLSLVSSFLDNRFAVIKQGNSVIGIRQLEKSCPQGSIISPFLWNILMDYVLCCDLECDKIAYADDCLLIVSADDMDRLLYKSNSVLRQFNRMCSNVKLQINTLKTVYMVLKKRVIPEHFELKIDELVLKRQRQIKYLGVTTSDKLSFNGHVKRIISSALSKLISFYRLGNSIWGYSNKMLELLYRGVVEPTVTYASSVWFKANKI